jgi:uncharacterized protein YeaO (DUF488 family)
MAARKAVVTVKRVYEEPSPSDGVRVLVDRLWPRGLKKAEARIDAWLRDLAPSNELRKWFHRHPQEPQQFDKRYGEELHGAAAREALSGLENLVKDEGKVTLLFASKNIEYNNATVLREIVEGAKKASIRSSSPKREDHRRKAESRRLKA